MTAGHETNTSPGSKWKWKRTRNEEEKYNHLNWHISCRVSLGIEWSKLPHLYYFTTRILVLKFDKGVFLWESKIRIFLEKGDILVLTSLNLEKKGLILMSSVLPWKRGFIWAEKPVCYYKKGLIHFGLKSQCFIVKKRLFWVEKSVFCY